MYFDRFDICEAYLFFTWNFGSYSNELAEFENKVIAQLRKLQYRQSILSNYAPKELSANGKVIYMSLVHKYFN